MKITLVRHSSVSVLPGICYGQTDVDVSTEFEQEAEAVYAKIKHINFDKVYTSPLSRCVKLASFKGYFDFESDERLQEMNFGEWEMKPWNEITDPQLQKWFNNWVEEPATGGESFQQMAERVISFWDELKKKSDDNVLIFCHAGIIRAFHCLIHNIELINSFDLNVGFAEVFVYEM